MKKVISVLITLGCMFSIIISGSENVLADEGTLKEPINLMKTGDFGDYTVTDISQLEYIQKVAENENITFKEAQERVIPSSQSKQSVMMTSTAGSTIYRNVSWTQAYSRNSNYKAELSATFLIRGYGSFRQIDDYTQGSDSAAGSSQATWRESHYYPKASLPQTKVTVGVTGKFVLKRNVGGGVTVSIPGFSSSVNTSGTVTYTSSNMTIQKTYSLY
ncbi:hypothetical protein SAMN04488100_11420 [Alkalibacterium putridalgicola]|uniref:DUF5626 domain-containing protein n=1 Tax=Alkalibacterium putridalgicola TaxID=426703 RepID=A0A1H7TUN4_9LACT|nr:hypothetical protein [Alkalibacterium putridalgicola]GEK90160.1 hypothetical protein APU01nite_21990 [Alkalibacterium putridalgicola]SEL88229.1 hypothetical protein SAMN04488100_11420 [Alkalibacterium putridalgicola]